MTNEEYWFLLEEEFLNKLRSKYDKINKFNR
jgi:hypothetical protein